MFGTFWLLKFFELNFSLIFSPFSKSELSLIIEGFDQFEKYVESSEGAKNIAFLFDHSLSIFFSPSRSVGIEPDPHY